jgi:hypothetical protein
MVTIDKIIDAAVSEKQIINFTWPNIIWNEDVLQYNMECFLISDLGDTCRNDYFEPSCYIYNTNGTINTMSRYSFMDGHLAHMKYKSR